MGSLFRHGADNDIEGSDNVVELWHAVGDYLVFVPLVLKGY